MDKKVKKALLFVGLTFLFNYLLVFLYFAFGGVWENPGALIIAVTYMFIPMVVAIIIQKLIYKEPLKGPLAISFKLNRWFLVAWFLPLIFAFTTLMISILFPGVEFSLGMERMFEMLKGVLNPEQMEDALKMLEDFQNRPYQIMLLTIVQALFAGATINAIAGFGEELGWRGFLQKELGFMGFWKSSALIGFIWGIWHAPLILLGHNYPQHPQLGVLMMTVWTVLLAPMFSYARLKSKSVIAAAIMHGTLNASAGIPLMLVKGGTDLTVGMTGLAGFIALLFINIGIYIYDTRIAKEPVSSLIAG